MKKPWVIYDINYRNDDSIRVKGSTILMKLSNMLATKCDGVMGGESIKIRGYRGLCNGLHQLYILYIRAYSQPIFWI
jgi:hypothetical protein